VNFVTKYVKLIEIFLTKYVSKELLFFLNKMLEKKLKVISRLKKRYLLSF